MGCCNGVETIRFVDVSGGRSSAGLVACTGGAATATVAGAGALRGGAGSGALVIAAGAGSFEYSRNVKSNNFSGSPTLNRTRREAINGSEAFGSPASIAFEIVLGSTGMVETSLPCESLTITRAEKPSGESGRVQSS